MEDAYHQPLRVHDFFAKPLCFPGDHWLHWNLEHSMQFLGGRTVLVSDYHYIHPFVYDVRNAAPNDLVKLFTQ